MLGRAQVVLGANRQCTRHKIFLKFSNSCVVGHVGPYPVEANEYPFFSVIPPRLASELTLPSRYQQQSASLTSYFLIVVNRGYGGTM
jgi:hypothetical protein